MSTPSRKPLGADFWKQQAGLGDQRLSDDWRRLLICPDDDAPLDYQPIPYAFVCPVCTRRFEESAEFLTLLPTNDPYQLSEAERQRLAERAQVAQPSPTPQERFPGLWQKALQIAGNLSGKRVLELCCGSAAAAVEFARSGASVGAVDIVSGPGGLQGASQRAKEAGVSLSLFRADVVRLPFLPQSFDVVFVADAIHLMPRPERFLMEVGRVLRRDGVFLNLGEPMATSAARAFSSSDPRKSGHTLSLADYEGIYREGGLTLSFYLVDEAGEPTGFFSRLHRRFKAHQSTEERLLVGKIPPDFQLPTLPWRRKGAARDDQ